MPEHPAVTHMLKIREAMLARDSALLNRITRDYLRAFAALKTEIKTLQEAIKAAKAAGKPIGKGDLARLAALQNLLEGVRREMDKFSSQLAENLADAIALELQMANIDALDLVQLSLPGMEPAALIGRWTVLQPAQVYSAFGFLDPDGPLFASIKHQFGEAIADLVRDAFLTGFISGMNPRDIAALIARASGSGLTWALSMARTAALWSYRSASHLNYLNNSHVVKAWMWFAQLDQRVCLSCIAQHGSTHPLNEVLADHHQGRCTSLPITASYEELGIEGVEDVPLNVQRGEDWFKGLPASVQKEMMGPAMYKAWSEGAFDFSQLSVTYQDAVYGTMRREASLIGILGDKANLYYGAK